MFKIIYQKELLNQIGSQKFAVSLLLVLALTLLSVSLAGEQYKHRLHEYSKVIAKQQSIQSATRSMTLETLGDGNFETVDMLIVRKPTALSIFAGEKEYTLGDVVEIELREYSVYAQPYSALNDIIPIRLRDFMSKISGLFDFSNIIKILFSLIAILVGFDIISREKMEGTLRQIHANSISRATFLYAKWTAGFTVTVLAVLFSFLLALLYLLLRKNIVFSFEEMLRIALFGCGSILYLSFFYTLAVLASTIAGESKHAIMIMLITWVSVVFVIPNTVHIAAERLFVDTPMDELTTQKMAVYKKDAETTTRLRNENKIRELKEIRARQRKDINEIKKKQYEQHLAQRAKIQSFIMISPAVCYQELSERILGTSADDYMAFMDRARTLNGIYEDMFAEYVSRKQRTFEFRKSFNVELNDTFIRASSDNNRLSLRDSLSSTLLLLTMFMVVTMLVFMLNLYTYNTAKTLV